jgi:hypothetical protein
VKAGDNDYVASFQSIENGIGESVKQSTPNIPVDYWKAFGVFGNCPDKVMSRVKKLISQPRPLRFAPTVRKTPVPQQLEASFRQGASRALTNLGNNLVPRDSQVVVPIHFVYPRIQLTPLFGR